MKRKQLEDKSVQTGECTITAADLTSEEPSADYWKRLAEKREDLLNESFQENERLKETIDALQEENRICKEMLDESKNLVEVLQVWLWICKVDELITEFLQEMLEEGDASAENTEDTN